MPRSRPGRVRSQRAGRPDQGRGRGTGRSRLRLTGRPADPGMSREAAFLRSGPPRCDPFRRSRRGHGAVEAPLPPAEPAGVELPAAAVGTGVGAGRSEAGTNQPGRDAPSSPETWVSGTVSFTVQLPFDPSRRARSRSTIWPARWRKAIESPVGDQTGENEWPSLVTRRTSFPFMSRMTTSVPKLSVLV